MPAKKPPRAQQVVTTPAQIGEIIRGRRKARGLSQAELARRVGLSQSRLSILESDPSSVSLDQLILLVKLLGLELVIMDKAEERPTRAQW